MDALISLLVIVAVNLVLMVVMFRRRQAHGPDDLKRVGDDHALTPDQAALRGRGKSAWMRPSNFGG